MLAFFLAAALSAAPAHAWLVDLTSDGAPAGQDDRGRQVIELYVPARVLAAREDIRLLGARGTALRGDDGLQCSAYLSDGSGTITWGYDGCGDIYSLTPDRHRALAVQPPAPQPAHVLRLSLAPSVDSGPVVVEPSGALLLPGAPHGASSASMYLDGRWWPVRLDPRTWQMLPEAEAADALGAWLAEPGQPMLVRTEYVDGTEVQWRLDPLAVPAELPLPAAWEPPEDPRIPPPPAAPAPGVPALVERWNAWCGPESPPGRAGRVFLVCIDGDTGEVDTRRYQSTGIIVQTGSRTLPTDHFIEVVVRHATGRDLKIELGDGSVLSRGEELVEPLLAPVGATRVNTRRRFAPRAAGPLTLEVTSDRGLLAHEDLQVVERYGGAVRLGLGVTAPASRKYGTGTAQDGVAPITRVSDDLLEGELVVSYAHFIERGGRDYLSDRQLRLAPMLGLGVLAVSGTDLRVTAFTSYYAGVDVELTPGFAVDFAFTLRRVQRLDARYEVGDLIPSDAEVETAHVFRPGLGVVLSLTPQLFRLPATQR